MSKKEKFIAMVENLIDHRDVGIELDADALAYFEGLKAAKEKEKPAFTDNGKLILNFMKDKQGAFNNMFKAKDIAEGIFVASRAVSGSIRKLVTDEYVEKVGQDPIVYSLTQRGKDVVIDA